MDKVIEAAKRISIVLGALVLILLIGYFAFLDYFGKSFPLPVFFEIQRIWIIALAIGLLLFLPTLRASKFPILIRILVFLIASPFCCLFSYIAFQAPTTFLDTTEFNNYRYYITVQGAFAEPRTV